MIDLYDYAIDKAIEYISGTPIKHIGRLQFRCVFCGDSKKKLGMKRGWLIRDKDSFHYHCYNCQRHYGAYEFLMELESKSYKEVRSDLFSIYKEIGFSDAIKNILNNEALKVLGETDLVVEEVKSEQTFQLQSTWEDIEKHPKAFKEIQKRHIFEAPNLPPRFKLYYDVKFDKIVIPWYRENKLRYYQYRVIGKGEGPKYQFPKNTEKDIFGLDNIDYDFPYVFFTEGALDSVWVKNGICVGGITLTDHQKKILRMIMETHELIYFPDNPFIDKSAKEEIFKLLDKDKHQKIFQWDRTSKYKDVNEEIIDTKDFTKYMDEKYLLKHITNLSKYMIMLKFASK